MSLRSLVGYSTSTDFAYNLVQGKAPIPTDVDSPTAALIRECEHLLQRLQHTHKPVEITPDNYCYYWGQARENTLSAILTVHFGHWKAMTKVKTLVEFLCTQLNLIAQTGNKPEHWGVGLQGFA